MTTRVLSLPASDNKKEKMSKLAEGFNIPVVMIIFKRTEKTLQILERVKAVQPKKLYLIADAGRNEEEKVMAQACRTAVENAIDWDCEVVKDYAKENHGCFDRIGLGALRVFEKEKTAIFLEDDNMPEVTFFFFSKEMLEKYEKAEEVLWVCGTNYLEKYTPNNKADYVFSRHMFPCGWASWADKFTRCYDSEFSLLTDENLKRIKNEYHNSKLFFYDLKHWKMEMNNRKTKGRYVSWDYQMCFSLRVHQKIGIVPKYNQIRNIGVDVFSEHGGTSMNLLMTQRFCGMDSFPLSFPLKHPRYIEVDRKFEKATDRIILPPSAQISDLKKGISGLEKYLVTLARKLLKVPEDRRLRHAIKELFIKKQ